MTKIEKIVVGIALIISLVIGYSALTGTKSYLGGNFNSVVVDFAQGISVNGTRVISNTGKFLGTLTGAITGTTATLSSTLDVTGATTVSTLTQGGGVTATTTLSTTATLLPANFDTEDVLAVTPGGASLTLTLPASSTLTSFIPVAGQTRTIYIRNATTTAGVNITIAGGTGTTLVIASTTVIVGNTSGSSYGKIDFVRRSESNISALLSVFH